jgi:hypothetical protein
MPFKPIIHPTTIEDGGEQFTFHVREASGREVLSYKRKKDAENIDNTREMFAAFVVTSEGAKIPKEEVEEMLDWRLTAMMKAADEVARLSGLQPEKKVATPTSA